MKKMGTVPAKIPRDSILEAVLKDVLEGRIKAGTRLITDVLAKRFGVSHTPVREALLTLAGMGVVQVLPNRGAIVKQFSPREIREICDVRLALELLAVRKACGAIDVDTLRQMQIEFVRLAESQGDINAEDVQIATALDTQLHALIRDHSKNQFLILELTRVHSLVTVIRDAAWGQLILENNLVRVVEEARQHLEIVDALMANNVKRAEKAMRTHLLTGKKTIVRAVLQNPVEQQS